ncbi:hypothetical protein NEMIN01_1757 [Nematocida minor]|uniref:uncharacterized protein n=1 Tax=Nematocida minor TaxID=1912983 RepID=UPI00221F29E7|nr:uncharacterized protein NEMIN01_1757 [Nematocida minor]KAI5191973.1 hypothetical protein NEMIN01_1757 [Nematocida minor]
MYKNDLMGMANRAMSEVNDTVFPSGDMEEHSNLFIVFGVLGVFVILLLIVVVYLIIRKTKINSSTLERINKLAAENEKIKEENSKLFAIIRQMEAEKAVNHDEGIEAQKKDIEEERRYLNEERRRLDGELRRIDSKKTEVEDIYIKIRKIKEEADSAENKYTQEIETLSERNKTLEKEIKRLADVIKLFEQENKAAEEVLVEVVQV